MLTKNTGLYAVTIQLLSLKAHISSVRILTKLRPSQSCVHFQQQQQQDILFLFSWALVKHLVPRLTMSAAVTSVSQTACWRDLGQHFTHWTGLVGPRVSVHVVTTQMSLSLPEIEPAFQGSTFQRHAPR